MRYTIAPLSGYPIYALIAAFTGFTLLPNTTWEIATLALLCVMGVVGQLMDDGAKRAARRGDPTAERYLMDWGLDKD